MNHTHHDSDQCEHHAGHSPSQHESHGHPHETSPAKPAGLTLRIPKPNWQVTALILIALIAGLQTFQLIRLKGSITANASTAPSGAGATTTGASNDADLQAQVGGC